MVDEVSVPRFTEQDTFPASIPMLQNGWAPTGGPVNVAADQGLLNWPLRELTKRTRNLKGRLDDMALKAGALVTVGPGGDYASINLALADLSERRPAYTPGGFITEVRLLTGFTMAQQVLVSGINLGWANITCEAAEVLIDRAYLTTLIGGSYPAFCAAKGGTLPAINALFNMMANGDGTGRDGISVIDGGFVRIGTGAGVRNAGGTGLSVATSGAASANNAIFTNAGVDAVAGAGGTRITVSQADLTGAGRYEIRAYNGSVIHAWGANCSGAATSGLLAGRGASINAVGVNARRGASDSSTDIVVEEGSTIAANGATGGTNVTVNTLTAAGSITR